MKLSHGLGAFTAGLARLPPPGDSHGNGVSDSTSGITQTAQDPALQEASTTRMKAVST
jgi:hypothetical protein